MSHLTYLLTILAFCGIPFLIMLHYKKKILRRYELVIVVMIILGIIGVFSEYFALRWGAWYYIPARTLNVHIFAELETYLLGAGYVLALSSLTIISANIVDKKNRKYKRGSRKRT